MSLNAGRFDRSIEIQVATEVQDPNSGELQSSWGTFATVMASFMPLKQSERFTSGRDLAVYTARFKIRTISGLTEKHRIVFEGKNWDITGIEEITRRQGHIVTAEVRE